MKQKGFTLIEILVAMLVGGMIIAVVVTSIFQMMTGTGKIREDTVALSDLESATHWLTWDIPMGHTITLVDGAPPTDNMTVSWNDYTTEAELEEAVYHFITYTHSGSELTRNYDGVVTIVGRHLTYVGFSLNGKMVSINLTSSTNDYPISVVSRHYRLRMRSDTSF